MGTKKKQEPLHIIVRTHNREDYFNRCIESIISQNYPVKILVVADTPGSFAYADQALKNRLIDSLTGITRSDVEHDFADFSWLVKRGLCGDKDYQKHFYDLYLNRIVEQIDSGWIMFVDDDKELPSGVLERIGKNLKDVDKLIVGQYQMKSRILPDGEQFGVLPFKRAHIDMSCIVFHSKWKKFARLDGHGAGDWRMCNRLAGNIKKLIWMREPFTIADNDGNFGRSGNAHTRNI